MAAFTEYNPGPTIAEQHNSAAVLFQAFFDAATPERIGSIGGSASRTWYVSGFSVTAGANPSINILWSETTAVDTATTIVRYNASLLGTVDPSWYSITQDYVRLWLSALSQAQWNTWRTRVGAPGWPTVIGYPVANILANLHGGGTFFGSTGAAETLYTDGARINQPAAVRLTVNYNPTAGELTAGIKQCLHSAVAVPTDPGSDINVGASGVSIGESVLQVPVPIAAGTQAEQSWADWVWSQLTSPRIVTHVDDLGDPGTATNEPLPADATSVFATAGQAADLATVPALWGGVTNLPAAILGMVIAVGRYVASMAAAGIVAATGTALAAISTISGTLSNLLTQATTAATNLGTIGSNVSTVATNVDGVSTVLQSIETGALDVVAVELPQITSALQSTALEASVGALPTPAALSVSGRIDALRQEAASIVASLGTLPTPAAASIAGRIESGAAAVAASIDALRVAVDGLEGSASSIVTQLDRVADALEASVVAGPGPGHYTAVEDALECICDSLKADPGADPPVYRLAEGIRRLQDRLGDVADLRQTMELRAKGIAVVSTFGTEPDP